MWWHLTLLGAAESDGLVPDGDVESGVAVPGWVFGGPGEPDVFVGHVDRGEPDPAAAIRALAQRFVGGE